MLPIPTRHNSCRSNHKKTPFPRPALGFQNVANIRLRAVDARANGDTPPIQGRSTKAVTRDGHAFEVAEPASDA